MYPSLDDALRDPPLTREAQVVTSLRGVVLAEAEPTCGCTGARYGWRLTGAGADVLEGGVRGMARAS
jgi:hypothetical protein